MKYPEYHSGLLENKQQNNNNGESLNRKFKVKK